MNAFLNFGSTVTDLLASENASMWQKWFLLNFFGGGGLKIK